MKFNNLSDLYGLFNNDIGDIIVKAQDQSTILLYFDDHEEARLTSSTGLSSSFSFKVHRNKEVHLENLEDIAKKLSDKTNLVLQVKGKDNEGCFFMQDIIGDIKSCEIKESDDYLYLNFIVRKIILEEWN